MRVILILTCAIILQLNQQAHSQEAQKNEVYAAKIITLKKKDQALRKEYGEALKTETVTDSVKNAISKMDMVHNALLENLVRKYGYPNASEVGMEATHAFWILAMHQDKNPTFQEGVLTWMREAVKRKDALTRDLAYLEDRVSVNRGECQLYGTQVDYDDSSKKYFSFPICDLKKMKKLRKKMKLMTLDRQLEQENQ